MVKVKCDKHGDHLLKPTDAAVLIEHYRMMAAGLAYSPSLPQNEYSNTVRLLSILCPMDDLNRLKSGKEISRKTAK